MTRGTVHLKSYEFRRERETSWRELDRLVSAIEKRGIQSLPPQSLSRLPLLYRAALSSLSVARSISLDRNVLDFLDSLSTRAFFAVYGVRRRFAETARIFVVESFPRTARRYFLHILIAGLFLLLGTATGYFLTLQDSEHYYAFVPDGYAAGRDPAATTDTLREALYVDVDRADVLTHFAFFLFTHNAQIGILAFALGIAFGVPVFVLLFVHTGLLFGAMTALYSSRGLALEWFGWVLPHGVTELFAVVLCGAGGLALAQSVIWPGRRTRLENLADRGRDAGILLIGAVGMFLIAGLIEGILRQSIQNVVSRYLIVFASVTFWAFYLLLSGRGGRDARSRP
jgi:uncharacterized membrane protein SpoIIM required for sporulation